MLTYARELWRRLASAPVLDDDQSRRIRLVQITLALMSTVSLGLTLLILPGYLTGTFDRQPLWAMLGIHLAIGLAGGLARSGRWHLSAHVPPALFLLLDFYLTYSNGLSGSSSLSLVAALILAGMLGSLRMQWLTLIAGFVGELAIGLAQGPQAGGGFVEMLIPRIGLLTGIALLQTLGITQFQQAAARARAAAEELRQANARLQQGLQERDRAEQALRESETRFRALIENSADMITLLDAAGTVCYASPSVRQILGYRPDELIGMRDGFAQIHPEDRERMLLAFGQLSSAGASMRGELRLRRQDGSWCWGEATLTNLLAQPGVSAIVVNFRDITERKQAEAALRVSEEKFNRAFRASSVPMILSDQADQSIIDVNDAFCQGTGYARDEIVGRTGLQLNLWTDLDAQALHLAIIEEQGFIRDLEMRYRKKTGEQADALLSAVVIEVDGQRCLLHTAVDITARRRAEAALRQLNAELEQRVTERTMQLAATLDEMESFSYSISHDLRTPLRAIDGFAHILLDEHQAALGADGQRYLKHIGDNARRMGELVDGLLVFMRLVRRPLARQFVDPAPMVQAVLLELEHARAGREIEVRVLPLPACQADPDLLRQVWLHLLSNAIKFTRSCARACIEVGCEGHDGRPVYYVRDNGPGFDQRYADQLFGLFQRLDSTDEFDGLGLGLALARRIVQRHGGQIWANSAVGQGATFFFHLTGGEPHENSRGYPAG